MFLTDGHVLARRHVQFLLVSYWFCIAQENLCRLCCVYEVCCRAFVEKYPTEFTNVELPKIQKATLDINH